MQKIFLSIILLLASFLLPAQTTSSQVVEWVEVLDTLNRIDIARAAGQHKTAAAELEAARDRWPKPFSELASEYLSYLKKNKEPHLSPSIGVDLFAEEIQNLENEALRKELEERIFQIRPVPQNACAFILMHRASTDFTAGNLQPALKMYQRVLRDYPDSSFRGACTFNVGIVKYKLHRFDEAITALKQLIKMNVNNREFYSTSVMDMGYRNYHYFSARGISDCYEKLGRYKDAYHWNNLARTTYPYEGWCGTCADMQRRSLDRTGDRIAFSGGIWLAVRHTASLLGKAWYGWIPLLIWIVLVIAILRKSPQKRAMMVHITCFVALAISVVFWLVTRYIPPFSPTRHEFSLLWGFAWLFSIIGFVIALILCKLKPGMARLIATAAVVVMALVHIMFLIWLIGQIEFTRLSLHDIQLLIFNFILFPAATVVSAGTAVVTLVARLKGGKFIRVKKVDPVSGAEVKVHEVASYSSYMFHWASKYDLIFWPMIAEQWIWFSPQSGYAAFGNDFEKLKGTDKEKVTSWLSEHYHPGTKQKTHEEKLLWLENIYRQRKMDDHFWCYYYRLMAYFYSERGYGKSDPKKSLEYVKKALPLLHRLEGQRHSGFEGIKIHFLLGEYYLRLGNVDNAKLYFGLAREQEYEDKSGKIQKGHPYFLKIIKEREKSTGKQLLEESP